MQVHDRALVVEGMVEPVADDEVLCELSDSEGTDGQALN